MKKKTVIAAAACIVMMPCLYTHRRIVCSVIQSEPIPKAPAWHFWCKSR